MANDRLFDGAESPERLPESSGSRLDTKTVDDLILEGRYPSIDGPVTTPSLRTLGTGARQAAAGDDPRFAFTEYSVQFVSPGGDNSNPGTIDLPKKTAAAAYLALQNGGTLLCASGTSWSDGTEGNGLIAGQGCYLTQATAIPPGFLAVKPIEVRGWGLDRVAPLGFSYAQLNFGTVDLNSRRNPNIWLVSSPVPIRFIDVGIQGTLPARVGWDYRRLQDGSLAPAFSAVTAASRISGLTTLTVNSPPAWNITTMERRLVAGIWTTFATWNEAYLPSAHPGCLVAISSSNETLFPSGPYTIVSVSQNGPATTIGYVDLQTTTVLPTPMSGSTAAGHMVQPFDIIELESTSPTFLSTMYQVTAVSPTTIVVNDPYGVDGSDTSIGNYVLQLRSLYASVTNDTWRNVVLQCVADSDPYRRVSGPAMDRGSSTGGVQWTLNEGGYYSGVQYNSGGAAGIPEKNRASAIFGSGGSFGRPFINIQGSQVQGGGIRLVGSRDNSWGAIVQDVIYEAAGQVQVAPCVAFDAVNSSGAYIRLIDCNVADFPSGENTPAVDLGGASGQVYIEGCPGVIGSQLGFTDHVLQAVSINEMNSWTSATSSLEALGRVGWWGNDGRIAGKRIDAQSQFGVVQNVGIANLISTNLSSWVVHSGSIAVTGGQSAPDGTPSAFTLSGTGILSPPSYSSPISPTLSGDVVMFGMWAKGPILPGNLVAAVYADGSVVPNIQSPFLGDGEWQWVTGFGTFTSTGSLLVSFGIYIASSLVVYQPTLYRLSAASYSTNEIYRILNSFRPVPSYLPAGVSGTMAGQKLIGHGGLGTAARYTVGVGSGQITLGSQNGNAIQLFDESGNSLGVVPLYAFSVNP